MVKQKGSAGGVSKTNTKKLQQIAKGKAGWVKRKTKPENGDKADESSEGTVVRRAKPKSRAPKPKGKTPEEVTSKYFSDQARVKEESVTASHGDDIGTPYMGGGETAMKVEKEEEEESEDDEWEDVEELVEAPCAQGLEKPVLPSQPVEIEIETPDHARKRQRREKREVEFETYLRRMTNRFNKDVLVDTHKVHLLCLVANGIFQNRLCSQPDLLAVGLSVLPTHLTVVTPDQADEDFLRALLKWFRGTFTFDPEVAQDQGHSPQAILQRRFETRSARDHQEMTQLFLVILRSLQLFCRLVLSLQPLPLKPPSAKNKAKTSGSTPKKSPSQPQVSPGVKRPGESSGGGAGPGGKRRRKSKAEEEKVGAGAGAVSGAGAGRGPKNSQRRRVASKVSYKEDSSEGRRRRRRRASVKGRSSSPLVGRTARALEEGLTQGRIGRGGARVRLVGDQGARTQAVKGRRRRRRRRRKKRRRRRRRRRRRGRGRGKKEWGLDEWLEVYLERVGRWVCLGVQQAGFGSPRKTAVQATQPMSYVLAVDGDGHLKDLSSKYDLTWMTSSRKRCVELEWWEETLSGFRGPTSQRERREDKELRAKLLAKPLPTAMSMFKNHPLYALKKHLLKYEAIYPPTAAILGYCRGEAVYSRDCVHTLHSRDTWLKEARTVLLGEEPYKMVKGFSNRARKARQGAEQKDRDDLGLFGEWQTEEYQPPIAMDGKVPRNDYGNVYLFRPCMLPVGCVHVRLPSLHRVARKLDIDCASAVTGFDFHCGFSHPVTDGYVVCEEYQEVLQAAWENEQDILQKKEREKREKRAVDHWTLLVKGLLIRERLQRRYGRQGPEPSLANEGEKGLSSGEEDNEGVDPAAMTLASSWPQNRQEEGEANLTTKREKRALQKNLFPFEKFLSSFLLRLSVSRTELIASLCSHPGSAQRSGSLLPWRYLSLLSLPNPRVPHE
ncbi:hypothetical protein AAFF_G00059420 [Aldrovandia affinis]|uniref:Xeroderma pigmentosum, complementation group C n=1 Tax=Aldrovandia affinis TaxID=143900 RepID=A0AAD7S010_9TELE|nr:hypothetical protein AAFF_G00059420 [Aldrovandia affinis]